MRTLLRSTISGSARAEGRFEREAPQKPQYGHVIVAVEPAELGEGISVAIEADEADIPASFHAAVEQGARSATEASQLTGFPLMDLRIRVTGGSFVDGVSAEAAFRVAASIAARDAIREAGAAVLEPVFAVEIVVPEEYMGDIIGDVTRRRGHVTEMEDEPGLKVIKAMVPLAEMFGYATDVRSMSQGRASYTMVFAEYAQVPRAIQEEILR